MEEQQVTLADLWSNIKQRAQTFIDAFYQAVNQLVLPVVEQLVKRNSLLLELLELEKELQRTKQLLKYTKHSKKREKHLKRLKQVQQQISTLNQEFVNHLAEEYNRKG